MQFGDVVAEVQEYVMEWQAESSIEIPRSFVLDWSKVLHLLRQHTTDYYCLHASNSGARVWVRNRINELSLENFQKELSDKYAIPDEHVSCVLHFEAWDQEQYGPSFTRVEVSSLAEYMCSGYSRTPSSQLVGRQPVNKVAAVTTPVTVNYLCSYCQRKFLSLNGLQLHVRNVHAVTPDPESRKILRNF